MGKISITLGLIFGLMFIIDVIIPDSLYLIDEIILLILTIIFFYAGLSEEDTGENEDDE